MIEVFEPGTYVSVIDNTKIKGRINEVIIQPNRSVSYKVSYWIDNEHKELVFYHHELGRLKDTASLKIGFSFDERVEYLKRQEAATKPITQGA